VQVAKFNRTSRSTGPRGRDDADSKANRNNLNNFGSRSTGLHARMVPIQIGITQVLVLEGLLVCKHKIIPILIGGIVIQEILVLHLLVDQGGFTFIMRMLQ